MLKRCLTYVARGSTPRAPTSGSRRRRAAAFLKRIKDQCVGAVYDTVARGGRASGNADEFSRGATPVRWHRWRESVRRVLKHAVRVQTEPNAAARSLLDYDFRARGELLCRGGVRLPNGDRQRLSRLECRAYHV